MFPRKIIQKMLHWKDKKDRKPLIIRGARQVGKTSAIQLFGQKYFDSIIHINLEKTAHLKHFTEPLSLNDFETIIRIVFKKKLKPNTLLFIDEIQNSEHLMKLLRFFYEEKPEIPVIAAGSLLEAKIQKGGFHIPVGRVEYMFLFPLDYFEYLEALGKEELLEYLNNLDEKTPLKDSIHQTLLEEFYNYTSTGGMPEIIKNLLINTSKEDLDSIFSSLLTSYMEDIHKYSTQQYIKYISFVLENTPLFAGERITYHNFAGSTYKSREISESFSIIEKVLLSYLVRATISKKIPLTAKLKYPPKLLFLDVGLVNWALGVTEKDFFKLPELDSLYRGKIAEQIVGQNLLALNSSSLQKLYYWTKPKKLGSAEVDFCLSHAGKIVGIEIKSGNSSKLKSLVEFAKNVENPYLIRIYSGKLKKEHLKIGSKTKPLLSLPFYLLPRIYDFIKT